MTPRRRAALIVGLVLILVAIAIFVILTLRKTVAPPSAPPADDVAPVITEEPAVAQPTFQNPFIVQAPSTPGRTASRQMAELFAERYGSYSNQGDYQNLRDLLPVMTARYRQETEAYLQTAEAATGQPYVGVTSVKISTDVRSITDDDAVIAVTLQQAKTTGTDAPVLGYRTLRMELKLVGSDWRVDKAAWEN